MTKVKDHRISLFLAVIHAGGFSKAARGLGLTQPAVSQNISALEKELGVTLFERSRSSVSLTAEGRIFMDYATRIDALYDEVSAVFSPNMRPKEQPVVIATTDFIATHILPPALRHMENLTGATFSLSIYPENTDFQQLLLHPSPTSALSPEHTADHFHEHVSGIFQERPADYSHEHASDIFQENTAGHNLERHVDHLKEHPTNQLQGRSAGVFQEHTAGHNLERPADLAVILSPAMASDTGAHSVDLPSIGPAGRDSGLSARQPALDHTVLSARQAAFSSADSPSYSAGFKAGIPFDRTSGLSFTVLYTPRFSSKPFATLLQSLL